MTRNRLILVFINFNICTSSISDKKHYMFITLYKTIYWQGINIGNWWFFRKFTNIKIANYNNYVDTPIKPQLKTRKLEKKDMVASITNIISANCFSQTNSPNITPANKSSCTIIKLLFTFYCSAEVIVSSSSSSQKVMVNDVFSFRVSFPLTLT